MPAVAGRPDLSPLADERLIRRHARTGVDGQREIAVRHAMQLQPDEPFRVCLVDGVERQVLDGAAVDPCLKARAVGDNPHEVPSVVDEEMMAVVDLVLA